MQTNLNNVFIYLDDSEPEQRFFQLVFAFKDEKNEYQNYTLDMLEGMPLEEFRGFMKIVAKKMMAEDPIVCREDCNV